ncbi:MAG: hypothetical protein WD226_08445 [Planctomycetota bacterium]
MKYLLSLFAAAVLALVLLWPDGERQGRTVGPEPNIEVAELPPEPSSSPAAAPERTNRQQPEPATEVAVPEVSATAAFLATVPFEQQPRLADEHLPAITGVAPPWELVAPVMEWNVRTCVGDSFEKVMNWSRARVMPKRFRTMVERHADNYDEALAVYDSYQPLFKELVDDWAVADLRYRKEVWERGLYERWSREEEPPPAASGNSSRENIISYGWTLSYTYIPGVCPEYDSVMARNEALHRELEYALQSVGVPPRGLRY